MSGNGEHIVKSYQQDLNRLRGLISEMGGLVESQLSNASRAVIEKDSDAASLAVEADPRVDAMEREVETFVIRLLALRAPVAMDLRNIVASLKVTGDLERIGDYSANIAKRSLVLNQFNLPISMAGVANMGRLVQENLKTIMDAVGDSDVDRAVEVWRADEIVDDIYNGLFREVVTHMMEDPRNITPCTHLLFIAKNLERIGDHSTNIAENLYYAVKGEALVGARPKGDQSAYTIVRAAREAS